MIESEVRRKHFFGLSGFGDLIGTCMGNGAGIGISGLKLPMGNLLLILKMLKKPWSKAIGLPSAFMKNARN